MIRTLLVAVLLAEPSPAPEATVVAEPGESLEALAKRAMGDADAASELRAINRLPAVGKLRPGEKVRLPGPERDAARSAIAEAEAALARPDVAPKAKQKGLDVLVRARSALHSARYGTAIDTAHEALRAAGFDASKSKFSVSVADDGATRVSVSEGMPVLVEASGKATPVAAGASVHVNPGMAPGPTESLLPAPVAREPADGAVLHVGYTEGLIGPLAFTWSDVPGAEHYIVLLSHDVEGRNVVAQHEVVKGPLITALATGRYFWRVSARGANGLPGRWSAPIGFIVEPPPPKLEVGNPTWK